MLLGTLLANYGDGDGFMWLVPTPIQARSITLGFDRLWTGENVHGSSVLIAVQGNNVYSMFYDGDQSADALASTLKAKIAAAGN